MERLSLIYAFSCFGFFLFLALKAKHLASELLDIDFRFGRLILFIVELHQC